MKNIFLFLSLIFILPISVFSQENCRMQDYYNDLFYAIDYEDEEVKTKLIGMYKELEEEFCFAKLINENNAFLDYLLQQYSTIDYKVLDKTSTDTYLQGYIQQLSADMAFSDILDEWQAKTIHQKLTKDTFSFKEVLNVAVKNFLVDDVSSTHEGKVAYRPIVCSGENYHKNINSEPQYFLEAFTFNAIIKNIVKEEYGLLENYMDIVRDIVKIDLGENKEENLLRAHGAIFVMMSKNDALKQILIDEYHKQLDLLPFIIEDIGEI